MAIVRIDQYKINQRGERGFSMTLPRVWAEDNGIVPGDVVDVFRDAESGDLVIRKAEQTDTSTNDGDKK